MVDPKRLRRLYAGLAQKDLNPAAAMETIPALRKLAEQDGPIAGQPEIGGQLVALRRWTDRTTPQPRVPGNLNGPIRTHRGPISGPLPDKAWDRLFGALQVAELQAGSQGKRFGLNFGEFGNDATETYTPPGFGPRRRVMDPQQQELAREIGKAQQMAARRR